MTSDRDHRSTLAAAMLGTSIAAEHAERLTGLLARPDLVARRREEATAGLTLGATLADLVPAAASEVVGPLTGVDGRPFWLDFLPVTRLVPVYLHGGAEPAFLFTMRERRLRFDEPFPIDDLLPLLQRRYDLGPGSFWARADLFTADAPVHTFVGLRVSGGDVTFRPPPVDAGGRLTMPAGGRCVIRLGLEPQVAPASPGGRAGQDAAGSVVTTPVTVIFELGVAQMVATTIADAHWELFGQAMDLHWDEASPVYEPHVGGLLFPMTPSADTLAPVTVASPLVTLTGSAPIVASGWLLPLAATDVARPTEAAGAGGLAVQTGAGFSLGWAGLVDGPAALPSPWFALFPGTVGVFDPLAADREGTQRLALWDGQTSRSEARLRFTAAFPVTFASSAAGSDVLVTRASVDGRFDRPVDVRGTPLAVHTRRSLLQLALTDSDRTVRLVDDDVLADALARQRRFPMEPGAAIALAIRNALFTTTPVNSLVLSGTMADDAVTVTTGSLALGLGLYGVLPTLPDPYAARAGWLAAGDRPADVVQVDALLRARVTWDSRVDTSFEFVALDGDEVDPFRRWAEQGERPLLGLPAAAVAVPTPEGIDAARAAAPNDERQRQAEDTWHRLFDVFDREQFALLDVSTNADQMGVSFAWPSGREFERGSTPFHQAFARPRADDRTPPIEVRKLGLSAPSRYVRAFALPGISWEPVVNLTEPDTGFDPPVGPNLYPDDGGPTRLFTDSDDIVAIEPVTVVQHFVRDFNLRPDGFSGGLFTLPFGMRAVAEFSRVNPVTGDPATAARVSLNREVFGGGDLTGGLQLRVDAPSNEPESPIFPGSTLQFANVLRATGAPSGTGTLGGSVGTVFNKEFFLDVPTGYHQRGVPVTRLDLSGYGASTFSHWLNPNAAVAATSQVFFDVFIGRTAHEIVQIRSILYPWGVHVVRTITLARASSGYVFRHDSGWQAESDGTFDFRFHPYAAGTRNVIEVASPYEVHPGVVRGVFNVRNIHETAAVSPFNATWTKVGGDHFVDLNGEWQVLGPGDTLALDVIMQPVFFDADVGIDGVTSGAVGGRAPSRGMLGFVQLSPRGEPLDANRFKALLDAQLGSIGGAVDCVVDVAASGQPMRISRVDVSPSTDGTKPVFVASARGALTLPNNGAWSVVQHHQGSGEVTPLDAAVAVPLVRRGALDVATQRTDAGAADLLRLANPVDLITPPSPSSRHYGILMSTGTQKVLFRRPSFQEGLDSLLGDRPDFADPYRLVNAASLFPNVADVVGIPLGSFQTKIIPEGFKLTDPGQPGVPFPPVKLPRGPLFLVNESFLKIYLEYARTDSHGNQLGDAELAFGFDSGAPPGPDQWLAKVNDIGMVVDLGAMQRLLTVRGRFDTENGSRPAFREPELVFSDDLQPVIDILQVLSALSTGDYAAALKNGLDVAMSNSADSWQYTFHARQEIPVVKFPPEPVFSTSAVDPLKLQAHLAVGVYFNEALQATTDPKQLVPSAGAFLEFGGSLSVMCVSLAVATVYATGSVDLRTAADIKSGPSLHMKFGFGCEIVVGLPVVGGVTLTYMVGVTIDLDTGSIAVTGFLLFRGRAELLGGLVSVQIQIEASGGVKRTADTTDLTAQVTFGLDISIFLVINISFSQSWSETRQIA